MNNECQNALLKNLEEPAPNSYIIMVTDRSNVLLETIYSRCQIFNIPNLSSKEMNAWLSKRGISEINFNDFPSFYTPLKIIEDIENDRLRDDFYRVPQINENHVLNYFLSEIKNSIKI